MSLFVSQMVRSMNTVFFPGLFLMKIYIHFHDHFYLPAVMHTLGMITKSTGGNGAGKMIGDGLTRKIAPGKQSLRLIIYGIALRFLCHRLPPYGEFYGLTVRRDRKEKENKG